MRFTPTRVGVLLTGCGTHDGTEVGEAVLTLLELERQGVKPHPLVPAGEQMHVIDHASGEEISGATREMAAEAARITRGKIEILGETPPYRFQALIVPGGSGVAKNLLSGFLQPGASRRLRPPVREFLRALLDERKPVGTMSVSNFLLPELVDDSPVLPDRAGSAPEPLVVDPERRLVYAPAFLSSSSLAEVAEGIRALVDMVLHFAAEARREAGGST